MWCKVVSVVLLLGRLVLPSSSISTSLYALQDGSYTSSDSPLNFAQAVASGHLQLGMSDIGWDVLTLTLSEDQTDENMAYEAGRMEGSLTAQQINLHHKNTIVGACDKTPQTCQRVREFLTNNTDWARSSAAAKLDDPYWYQVHLFYKQMEGLFHGYSNSTQAKDQPLTFDDILWINMAMDIEDLKVAFAHESEKEFVQHMGHCSAIIKLSEDRKNVFFGHNSWITYNYMNRIVKNYYIPYKISKNSKQTIPGASMMFTSYPGRIYSMDDYYLIGSGLVAIETTNNVYDPVIYKNIKSVGQLMEPVRSMVANRLSTDGEQWTTHYGNMNSGTYNNQWMVLNLKKIIEGNVDSGLLHVVEQMPGKMVSGDQSKVLTSEGYWASYNIPFYPEIYNYSGTSTMFNQFGDQYSHGDCPRAKIFKREVSKVKDMDSLMTLLRYNHYLTDSASYCEKCNPHTNPQDAIASRYDLFPVNGTRWDGKPGYMLFGAIDAKGSSLELWSKGSMLLEAGPTHDGLPVFKWSSAPSTLPHEGIPDVANFPRITINWSKTWLSSTVLGSYSSTSSSSVLTTPFLLLFILFFITRWYRLN